MTLDYFENNVPHLIEEYYQLTFSQEIVPFQSTILPLGFTHITHVFFGKQKAIVNSKEVQIVDTVLSGQFFRSYQFFSETQAKSFGMSFHPTALYKILNTDISKIQNKHIALSKFHPDFENKINPIFKDYNDPEEMVMALNIFFSNLELTINDHTRSIDLVIEFIKSKDGLLTIQEILNQLDISQKTLENQFKKIVGLTPGKYIRLFRFLTLMRKYESQEIDFKELMFKFNYYDRSHFAKDFKLFMNETPKSYFKNEHLLIKAVFKNG